MNNLIVDEVILIIIKIALLITGLAGLDEWTALMKKARSLHAKKTKKTNTNKI